ncbi:hypothetical protein B484DRAFT_449725 [Ochromonadaceae sp. CCMP2298]|nr:hypothetical protein B484DRAFT_449725 [Ochromonadaceae sp. CCMP2298]
MGDRVVYFPQGHTLCLAKFPRVGPRESSPPPWMALPTRWPLVECEVRDLQYALPSSNKEWKTCVAVKAILTLAVVRVPAQYEFTEGRYKVQFREYHPHSFTFTVTLRDSDLPDFLVPTDLFMRSMCLPLEGVPVSVAFKQFSEEEGRYLWDSNPGRVIGMSNAISSWPDSPWYAVGVKADGRYGEEGRVCMWDCTPTSRMRIWTACPMIHMDTAEAQRIQEEMEELLRGPDADLYSPFELQVDPKAFPQYYDQIALPMYTDLIRHRLGSGYYRQGAALEHDVQQLYLNCVAFNSDASEISVAGKRLRDQLLRIIRPSREGAGSGSGSGSSTGSGSGSGGGAGAGTGAGAGNGNGNGDGDGARAGAGTGAGAGAEAGAPHTYTTALASADTAGSVVFRYRSSSSGNRWPSGLVSLHRTDTVATLLHTVAGQLRLPVGEIKVFRLGKELHGDGTVGQLHMLGQLGQEESLVVALVPAKSALKSGKSSGTSGTPPRTPRTPLTTVSFAEGQGVEAQTRTQGPSRVFPEEKSEQPASMSIRVRRTTIAPASAPAPAAAPAAAPASAPSR